MEVETIVKLSSREFNQDTGGAKRAAEDGPVFITDRGRPSHVLLTFDDYRKLAGTHPSIIELLSRPEGIADVDFEIVVSRDVAVPARID